MIPTPNGFRPLSELCPGDQILGRDGLPHDIVATSKVQRASAYRLTFDDGSELVAHDEHLWLTFDAKELLQLTKRTDEYREARRRSRPSRATGTRSEKFNASIVARNKRLPPPASPAPVGTVRTTAQIAATLRLKSGRANHAIPVASPIELPEKDLPLDPYVLGVWLGDGTTCNGDITTPDKQIVSELEAAGFPVRWKGGKPDNKASTYAHEGLRPVLKQMGLLGNKVIPDDYLWASRRQRLSLLQGLLDTDAGVEGSGGQVAFTNTRKALAEGVAHLARTLGHKATVREGVAKLNGRVIGPKWTVKFTPHEQVFRLATKADKLVLSKRRTTWFRYIVSAERVKPVEMKCLEVASPDRLYLAGEHFIPTHNSFGLLLEPLRHVNNPQFSAVVFRRTSPEIHNPGGIWDESTSLYPVLSATPRETESEWRFPSGAAIKFAHLEFDAILSRWQSSQIPLIEFDELTTFTEKQFWFMLSRNRSGCGVRPYIRAGCNPDAASWVATLVAWWIDQDTGYAIPERAGVLRWFYRVGGELQWFNSSAEAKKAHPDLAVQAEPKSLTFVPAEVHDNKILLAKNPDYLSNLLALPHIEQERFLRGNWKITNAAGEWPATYFLKNIWFDEWPRVLTVKVQACDPSKGKSSKSGDYSAIVSLGQDKDGILYCDADLARRPTEQIVEDSIELYRNWQGVAFGFEANGFQDLLANQVARVSRERGVRVPVFLMDNRTPKEVRIKRLGAYLARGTIRFKAGSPGAKLLVSQLQSFPNGDYDDGPDALEMAERLMKTLLGRAKQPKTRDTVRPG